MSDPDPLDRALGDVVVYGLLSLAVFCLTSAVGEAMAGQSLQALFCTGCGWMMTGTAGLAQLIGE